MEKHKQNSASLETFTLNAVGFIYALDIRGRFTYANKGMLDFLQLEVTDVLGKTLKELNLPFDLTATHHKQIEKVLYTQLPLRKRQVVLKEGSGQRHYEYLFSPIINREGKIEGVTVSTMDVTNHQNLQKLLKESLHELERIREASQLEKRIPDIKEPMINIEALVDILEEELGEEARQKVAEILGMIKQSIDRFKKLSKGITSGY